MEFSLLPGGTICGEARVPGDKSISHRSIMLGSLSEGVTRVSGFLEGDDALATLAAFRAMGVTIERPAEGEVVIHGVGLHGLRAPSGPIDLGNSGTSIRLMSGLLAGQDFDSVLTGDASLCGRPMGRVITPLQQMGADICGDEAGRPPLTIKGNKALHGIHYALPMASAQVKSCVLLAGLYAQGKTTVTEPATTRDHTERMLAWLGAPVRREGYVTTVEGPAGFKARTIDVPGDISGAAAWLVAGALHPDAHIVIEEVGLNPSRTGIIDVLRDMGADIKVASDGPTEWCPEPVGTITVSGGQPLRAINLAGDRVADVIDELPLIAMAMAAAEGVSTVSGARELRVKESDRIERVVEGLRAIGANAEEREDGWVVSRGSPQDAAVRTDGDHRIAMSFAVAALTGVAGTVEIDDPACAAVSYPTFWTDMEHLA